MSTAKKAHWIDAARWVKKEHQARAIDIDTNEMLELGREHELMADERREGVSDLPVKEVIIDAQTANALITVHDALNKKNKRAMHNFDVITASHVAWGTLQKAHDRNKGKRIIT